jgi:hypothetical protein
MRPTRPILAILLLGACRGEPLAPDAIGALPALSLEEPLPAPGHSARRAAVIAFYGDPLVVEVPSTARAGAPFDVGVTTYGGGCIAEDTTVATVADRLADVVPYQRIHRPGPNEGCTLELRITRRTARVTFPTAGLAVVRVTGRAAPGDSLVSVVRAVRVE